MKMKVSFFALIMLLILAMAIPQAQASTYLGQTTWTFTITESSHNPPGTTVTLTGGISKVGGSYYLFQGYILPPIGGLPFVLSGSGVLIGNNLILTLSSSQEQTSHYGIGVCHATIDKSTLNGTFYEVSTDLIKSDKNIYQGYTLGTLTCTGKVIPLNSSTSTGPMLLLE